MRICCVCGFNPDSHIQEKFITSMLAPLHLLVFKFREDSCTLSLCIHNLWTLNSMNWGIGNDWNFVASLVSHLWNYFWKMKYENLFIFASWKLDVNKYSNRLQKFMELVKLEKKIANENYEILQTEIWNITPDIFLKDESWAPIFLALKIFKHFLTVTHPLVWTISKCHLAVYDVTIPLIFIPNLWTIVFGSYGH